MSEEWTTVNTSNTETEEEKVEFEIESEISEGDAKTTQAENQQNANATSNTGEHEEQQVTGSEGESNNSEEPQSGAQKRIRQLVRQKKEREEQIETLMTRQQELENRLKAQQQEIKTSLEKNFESAEAQINSRIELAEDAYRQALESGDTDRIVTAQKNLNKAQGDSTTLQFTRTQYTPEEPQEQVAQPRQQQQQSAEYDRLAVEWAGRNPWFGQDNVMTTLALEIDQELKTEGYDSTDVDFYKEIDTRLRSKYPQRFGGEVQEERVQETSTPAQVVGGASRTSSASSGKKVRLTKEDVRLAEKWGIPLEQYAAEKLKVDTADGEYTSVY